MVLRGARERALSIPVGNSSMIKRGKAEKQAERKERLSAALRENLKRRKRQARGRAAAGQGDPGDVAAEKALQAAGSVPDFRRNRGGE
jgi:hypothetical protein